MQLEGASADLTANRAQILTKILRPALEEFQKRVAQNLRSLSGLEQGTIPARVAFGDAQHMPLADASVDLIVTSPPYASNAIDYMRAHKFSLIWLGHTIEELGDRRSDYIGGEKISDFPFEQLPPRTVGLVTEVAALDVRKGSVLRRYYSEMTRVLGEMHRVLKPGKAAILVVGSSHHAWSRHRDTELSSRYWPDNRL